MKGNQLFARSLGSKMLLLLICIIGVGILSVKAQASIEGQWREPKNGGVILIYKENGKYFGQLIASDDPEETAKIKAQGKILILRNFEKKSETEFCCGQIFQPREKRLIPGTLILESPTRLKINGRTGIFRGTQTWTKI